MVKSRRRATGVTARAGAVPTPVGGRDPWLIRQLFALAPRMLARARKVDGSDPGPRPRPPDPAPAPSAGRTGLALDDPAVEPLLGVGLEGGARTAAQPGVVGLQLPAHDVVGKLEAEDLVEPLAVLG